MFPTDAIIWLVGCLSRIGQGVVCVAFPSSLPRVQGNDIEIEIEIEMVPGGMLALPSTIFLVCRQCFGIMPMQALH